MTDDLIKRLRHGCLGDLRDDGSWDVDTEIVDAMLTEAADRIDELDWWINNNIRGCQCSEDEACAHVRRAEKAEAALAHAESDYKRMGDELLEVAHRSCERQMQLETVTAQLITARAELAVAREAL